MSDDTTFRNLPFVIGSVVLIREDCPVYPGMLGVVTDFLIPNTVKAMNKRGNIAVMFMLPNRKGVSECFVESEIDSYYTRTPLHDKYNFDFLMMRNR